MKEKLGPPDKKGRWFPEDERRQKQERKPPPFSDRIGPDGKREMHPVKSYALLALMLPMFIQAVNDVASRVGKVLGSKAEASEILKEAVACKNHLTSIDSGYCVIGREHTLLLAFPGSGDEESDYRFIQEELGRLSVQTQIATHPKILRDKKTDSWFISLTAENDEQLAAWLEQLYLLE